MVDRSYRVYVVQGQTERDWSDCQDALGSVPARVVAPVSYTHLTLPTIYSV